jgi:tRNA threonylcarbamoyladenosine biosynthesis protein TsaE
MNQAAPQTTSQTPPVRFELATEVATVSLGEALARSLEPGMTIYLSGDLGAGKTTLVRNMLRALGHADRVKSPTYTLVELYVVSKLNLYHFDFYRFNDPEEWNEAGFRDLFNGTNICLVEWPEKAGSLLPPPDLWVTLSLTSDQGRLAVIAAATATGKATLQAIAKRLPFLAVSSE